MWPRRCRSQDSSENGVGELVRERGEIEISVAEDEAPDGMLDAAIDEVANHARHDVGAKIAVAHAFLEDRGYVTPQDVKTIGLDVLRHRVVPSYEAEAENMTSEDLVGKIFDTIPVP